jgi:DNA invertase Pin-like site-specific DNA recombinase
MAIAWMWYYDGYAASESTIGKRGGSACSRCVGGAIMRSEHQEFRPKTKAVIYCRVSSAKQTTRGDGLGSQETRCREYARYKGLDVVQIFHDDMTGSLTTRPGMQAMLAFLRKHSKNGREPIVVIIDDISRLARGIDAHLRLRAAIGSAGGVLKSPTIEFGEDSDSILVENLLASVSQHQRQKNGEQTVNRMRARTMNGYWCFAAPIGYRYKRVSGHGNLLVRDEPLASIVQEALEGFAAGRFETQGEMKRFLESQPAYPKDFADGTIRFQRVSDLLSRPVYAGCVEAPKWNVQRRKGHHEPLISIETYERIQARLHERARAPVKKQIGIDFPLRGFVQCGDCSEPLTACWSRSSTGKRHPYYLCYNRDCASARKSIPRDKVEGEFAEIVARLQPSDGLVTLAHAMFKDAWDQRVAQGKAAQAHLRDLLSDLAKQTDRMLARIVESDNPAVVAAYEKKIADLENKKLILSEQLETEGKSHHAFEDMFELALSFLSNPWKLWASGQYHLRRIVLRLAFSDRVTYCRQSGFSNVKTALPFNILRGIGSTKLELARRTG